MEIQVAKQYLEKALSVVAPALSKESDITGHFVFRVRGDVAEVLANSGGRVFGSCPIVCQTDGEDGAFTVEAKRLKMWLQSVGDSALTLKEVDGEITVTSPEGDLPFQSLDPSTFPFWDKAIKKIEKAHKKRETAVKKGEEDPPPPVKFQVAAQKLGHALTYSKHFISDRDTVAPHLCITEIKMGYLVSTNTESATWIKMADLEHCSLRVHRKDIPAISTFLSIAGSEEIEILENDRAVYFRRSDGSLFGASRVNDKFPNLNFDQFLDESNWWEISPEEFLRAIKFVRAAADFDDHELNVEDDGTNFKIWLPAFHSKKRAQKVVTCVDRSKDEDGNPMVLDPFQINLNIFKDVLGSWKGKTAKVYLFPPGKDRRGGFLRMKEDRDGDLYSTVLTFLR